MEKSITATLICTTYNEKDSIERLLNTLLDQTRTPDEIIFVDGGSTDGTPTILSRFATETDLPITVLINKGCNISEGRNIAVRHASNDIIVSTDAGVRLADVWFEKIVAPFEERDDVNVVSGYYLPLMNNLFQKCAARFAYIPRDNINADSFLPSSRSIAYQKCAWEDVGGYPEDLFMAEDTLFDLNLQEAGKKFVFVPDAIVYWDHNVNLRDFVRRRYAYSYWAGIAGIGTGKLKTGIRFFGALSLLLVGLITRSILPLSAIILGVLLVVTYDVKRISRLNTDISGYWIGEFLLMSILRVLNDILVTVGFLYGNLNRMCVCQEP